MTATTIASLAVTHPRILMSQITSAYNFYTVASSSTIEVENLERAWWHMLDDVFWRNQRFDLADSYGNLPANSKQLAVFRDSVIGDAREKILGPQVERLVAGGVDPQVLVYHGLTDPKFLSDCARAGILPKDPVCSIIRSMEVYLADADELDVGEFCNVLKAALNVNYDGVYYELAEGSRTILDDYLQREKEIPDWERRHIKEPDVSLVHDANVVSMRRLRPFIENDFAKIALRDHFDWSSFREEDVLSNAVSCGLISQGLFDAIDRMWSARGALKLVQTKHDKTTSELAEVIKLNDLVSLNKLKNEHRDHKRTVRGLAVASLPLFVGGSAVLVPRAIQSFTSGASWGSMMVWSVLALANVLWALGSIVITIKPEVAMSNSSEGKHRNLGD